MPIYRYKCLKCGNEFEELILGEEKVKCPKCKSDSLKKLICNINTPRSNPNNSKTCADGTCNICPTCMP